MAAAMLFNNLSVDVFGCELKPNEAVSDEYMLCSGGSGQPDAQISTAADKDSKTRAATGFIGQLRRYSWHLLYQERGEPNSG